MIKLFSRGMTKLSRCLLALGTLLFTASAFGAEYYPDYPHSRTSDYTIGGGNVFHFLPGADWNLNGKSFQLASTDPASILSLEGGSILASYIIFQGANSTYRQSSGTVNLSRALYFNGGTAELSGGICNAPVIFNSSSASLKMLGGTLVGASMDGNSMGNSDLTFAACDAYAVTGSAESATYAITMTTPITKAPRSITVTGTPVRGCVYALVSGVADDTFQTTTTTLPDGWSLVRRDNKLLLVSTATLGIATATWTGLANDGNPRTPENWECHDASGQVITDPDALPNSATTVSVPADATNFNYPKSQMLDVKELRFLGETYMLNANADWSGLSSSFVSKYPATIDVNGHQLTLSEEPVSSPRDLTVPGDDKITMSKLDGTFYGGSSVANIIDDVISSNGRLMISNFGGCSLDYDFGATAGKVVRGVRFHTRDGYPERRPKEFTISGTTTDPSQAEEGDWTLLGSYSDLDIGSNTWSDYYSVDNETPYRAYRITITKNVGGSSNFLEIWEMELVEFTPTETEITSGVAGGELHFDVPSGTTVQNAKVALSGALKVVKENAGRLTLAKANQTFTGGVEVLQGWIVMGLNPSQGPVGGSPMTGSHATRITLNAGATLDVNGKTDWGLVDVYMNGGIVNGATTQFNPQLYFPADSSLNATDNFTWSGGQADLDGHTLTVDINTNGKNLYLGLTKMTNGVLNVNSGGFFANTVASDARTVDLKLNAALNLSADLSVHDYDALFNSYHNNGQAQFDVYGTFTPRNNYFYGCTLQDGAAIDLAAKTGEWLTTSQSQNRNTVDFADGATVTLALGARRPSKGDRLVYWNEEPTNMKSLNFVATYDDPNFAGEQLFAAASGVYYGVDPNAVDRAYWTGAAGDGNLANAGNWACTNVLNEGLAGALPDENSTICFGGNRAIDIPAGCGFACKRVAFTEKLTLTANCDWSGLALSLIPADAVIDLNGKKLTLAGFAGTSSAFTVTDSTTGEPGELRVNTQAKATFTSTVKLDGNLRLVTEGSADVVLKATHQTYTGGTVVAGGTLKLDCNPKEWPLGGDGVTTKDAMKVTVQSGCTLHVNGKADWDYVTIYLDGGTISGGSGNFNPTIVVEADSAITVPTANTTLTMGTDAIAADLGGKKISISAASNNGRFILNQTVLSNGVIDVVSGGWFESATPMDARTVDLRINAAMVLNGAMSVHDYDALFNSRHNVGTAALNVYGTFTPRTDYFYGCTLQDGATIDLSAKTGEWSTMSQSQERNTVDFADGATIAVDLGARKLKSGERVIVWSERPAKSVKFRTASGKDRLKVCDDGLYLYRPFVIMIY